MTDRLRSINMAAEEINEYSLREAAEYLALKPETLKHHYYKTKKLEGRCIGRTLIFTRVQLDKFAETPRPVGRPKKVVAVSRPPRGRRLRVRRTTSETAGTIDWTPSQD